MMNNYNKLNNILGWSVFILASFVYLSTIEQTVSFWDCGEYISTAYKLEVGHPPGAPLFQLFGRLFTLFAATGTSEVAVAINIMSALCSSLTILFLFWTITAFGRKVFANSEEIDGGKMYAVLGSGLVGALAYTFSDSFWFSAVEGEVYAMSSFFTAITFWCILKWEREADQSHASRWLILIAYLIGLSVGVHLLSLLTIPAMGMIYYYKNYECSQMGAIKAFITSIILLGIVQGVIIPMAVSLISSFELFFVNTIGLPFNSGTILYFLVLIATIIFGLQYTKKHNKAIWNTAILGFTVLLIGYSSFAILVVRSNSNPPIDENNPEDAVGLLSYLKREQYGSWPILYGHYFNAKLDNKEPYLDGNPVYERDENKGKYVVIDKRENTIPNYATRYKTIFPRMWSNTQSRHAAGYRNWGGLSKTNKDKPPTFSQNLSFFFKYQIGWSYLRYFMWNFAGRQNDFMNMDGNTIHGNWESGISFIDNARLGQSSDVKLPDYLKNNKAKNHYYFLPLILGLIGMFFHFKRSEKDAISVLLFFLFTGVLIIVYLNITPFQPRERDYAYVGSFYAFSIWIGLSVLGIYDFLKKRMNATTSAGLATVLALLLAPTLMASENWDDHDRTGRFTAREVAANYLNSCEKNAILFTNGDNDTFPLWYMQEVEGLRTDIKIVNLSLFNTSWYIDQMKRATYDAPPIPSSFTNKKYRTGTRDYIPISDRGLGFVDVKEVVDFIRSDKNQTKIVTNAGKRNYCPAKKLKLSVDIEKVKENGTVPKEKFDKILPEIRWKIKGNGFYKNQLMVLDMLAHNNWERPIYFAITVGTDNFMGLAKYFQLEGLTYRLVPYEANSPEGQIGEVNVDIMYDNLMNKFTWGGLNNPDVYLDETNTRMVMNFRNNYARLAETLFVMDRKEEAIAVLDRCVEQMPNTTAPFNVYAFPLVNAYYRLNEKDKGNMILADMIATFLDEFNYINSLKNKQGLNRNIQIAGSVLGNISKLIQTFQLAEPGYEYAELNGKYYKERAEEKQEISKEDYLINTFMEEYIAAQSKN